MMKSLISWFTDRTGITSGFRWLADTPVPGGACWCKVWSAAIFFAFCVQAMTGFVLWTFYSPSEQTAWESVYYVQYQVAGGWLLRSIHHYSAHVMLAMLILFVVQGIFTRKCRAPRELVFWVTVGLGLCALAAVLTGDLLSWDQNGYASTKTRTGFLTMLPWVGESLLKIAIGGPGPALGHHSVTRFFALHVGVFGAAFAGLLILYVILARRAAVAAVGTDRAEPYWPNQAWRSAAACVGVMIVILLLSLRHGWGEGVFLGSPADTNPANSYSAARPEWFLVGVYEFSHFFSGPWGIIPIFIVPGMLVGIALLMPFSARFMLGHVINVGFTVLLLIGLVALTWISLAKDRADLAHQKAIAVEHQQAVRVRELARHEGIPPTGALTLLLNDPKTQGPKLFGQHCASCHDHVAGEEAEGNVKSDKPSAPNLAGFATREWIAGLLDPKQVSTPAYFGGTKLTKMAGWVKETLVDLDDDDKKKYEQVAVALAAEASATPLDAKVIEENVKLLEEAECTSCHKFHDKGSLSGAPDLTGYGSPAWIRGIIRNPTDAHYYGKNNDRMPAYAPSADDPAQNLLSAREIELLTNWLRNDWYVETVEE